MKIIIAGGGIGGLVTALSMHQVGIEVKVFESVRTMKPLGVGINLLPHSMRVLTNLGLLDKIANVAVEAKDLVYTNRLGQFFWEEPRGKFGGYKWPQYSIHRGKFQVMLYEEAVRRIGPENVLLNHHFLHFEQDDNRVTATFIDSKTGEVQCKEEGDILIGADGIHSNVRKQLFPEEGEVKYSGNVLYRGTTYMKPYLSEASMVMIGSNKQKMVAYPISMPGADGRQLINWIANLKEPEDFQIKERDWNRQSDKKRLLDIYRDWTFDWLNVPYMIENAESVYEYPMSDRDPLSRWTFGRVTLMGDAAHAMYPIGSNGSSQAILDAEFLTNQLASTSNMFEALEKYESTRLPATSKVVLKNRQKGPDVMMDLMEDRFPDGFKPEEIPHDELNEIMESYKKIAGFDKQSLNEKN